MTFITDLLYEAEQSEIGQLFPFSSVYITVFAQCLQRQQAKEQATSELQFGSAS